MKGVASGESGDDTLTGGTVSLETTGTLGTREVDSGDFEQPPLTFRRFLAREDRKAVVLLLLTVLLLRLLFLLLVVTVVVQVVVVFKELLLC